MTDGEQTFEELWEAVLSDIEKEVSKATFTTWFKDTFIDGYSDGEVVIGVPNEFVKTWLQEKYHKLMLRLLREHHEAVRSITYHIGRKKKDRSDRRLTPITTNVLPLHNFYIDKNDNLNPRYTFESFVVGPFNELAYAAAQAVIKAPGTAYNPLFLYGKTGHGKTHLIQAIGNHIKTHFDGLKVFYLTSEKFAIDLVNSIKANSVNSFKEKYRRYDVLIMDDIQFLSNKEKTQEELFHLFNYLYDNNKQIVFSSDMHPNYLSNMEERLKSRFAAGMIVDIPSPDHESRVAILQAKAQTGGIRLAPETIDFLATSIEGNVRELEGVINSIIVQTQLKDRELSLNEIKNLIRNNIKTKKVVPVENIIRVVADYYNIDPELILKKTRKKEVVKPRQVVMYVLREDYNIPYPTIGQKLGGRDHTTVIHSYEKVKKEIKTDGKLSQEINQIRTML